MQTVLQPSAILDLHFHPSIPQFCGAVSSTGTIIVFDFVPEPSENEPIKNTQILRLPNIREDVLFLSFCWHPNQPDMLALTASTGSVFLVKLEQIDEDWSASSYLVMTHSVEAWTVALAPAVKAVLHDATSPRARSLSTSCFSGGDDSVLKHAVCSTYEGAGPGGAFGVLLSHQPVAIRGHNAGVTAILPLGVQTDLSELIVTGSYDDKIRLWSITPVDVTGGQRRAIMLAEHDLGGGVWRLKRIHLGPVAESAQDMGCAGWTTRLLASCMHAGPKIVQLQQLQTGHYEFRILAEFREHKSMNYGSDFRLISSTRLQCVSTSFYDKLVCLWDWDFSA